MMMIFLAMHGLGKVAFSRELHGKVRIDSIGIEKPRVPHEEAQAREVSDRKRWATLGCGGRGNRRSHSHWRRTGLEAVFGHAADGALSLTIGHNGQCQDQSCNDHKLFVCFHVSRGSLFLNTLLFSFLIVGVDDGLWLWPSGLYNNGIYMAYALWGWWFVFFLSSFNYYHRHMRIFFIPTG